MSCMESKMVLRAEIKSLKGKNVNEAYCYFKGLVGKPDDIEMDEIGDVNYFYYNDDSEDRRYVPVQEYPYKDSVNRKWGVDFVINKKNEYSDSYGQSSYKIIDLNEIIDEMVKIFNVSKDDISILSYEWYNGSEEHIEF